VKAVSRVEGRAVVLDRADVDTDQILPKQFLKRTARTGWAEFLFFDWRADPGFELNRPAAAGAKVLVAGRNFGCGSSREHAVWALADYGFEAVVAPSFADIFAANAQRNGLVLVALPPAEVRALVDEVDPVEGGAVVVDVEASTLTTPAGRSVSFELDPFVRRRLLEGLDDVALTLAHADEIAAFETRRDDVFSTLAL